MTNIPVGTCWFSRNNLKRHYLKKQKTFSGLFLAFLKCALNLEHFQKKDDYSSLVVSKVIASERGSYLNV